MPSRFRIRTPILGKNRSDSVSASLTHVFRPTLSNEFVFGYTYIDSPTSSRQEQVSRAALNIPFRDCSTMAWTRSFHDGWGGEFQRCSPRGFEAGEAPDFSRRSIYPLSATTCPRYGERHTAKFGAYYEYVINISREQTRIRTVFHSSNWAGGSSGIPYAASLAGFAGSTRNEFQQPPQRGYNSLEFFGMDSWKVRQTLDRRLRHAVSHLGACMTARGMGSLFWNPSAL